MNSPAGRLGGSNQINPPYVNALGSQCAQCEPSCEATPAPHQADGFASCLGWKNPVTVWRKNVATTN